MPKVCDHEAEQIVTGFLLNAAEDPDGAGALLSTLEPEDFDGTLQRTVFRGVHRVWTEGVPITTTAVHDALRAIGFDQPTHADLLKMQLATRASRESADAAGRTIQNLRRWRSLIEIGSSFADAYKLGRVSVEQVISQALVDFDSLREKRSGMSTMSEILQQRVAELRDAQGKPVRRILTGFSPLDRLTGGLGESELVVLAAATGGGKTSLAGHILETVAASGRNVLVASAEMHGWELGDRLLSRVSYVPLQEIRDNKLDEEQRNELDRIAAQDAWKRVMVLERQGTFTIQHIAMAARTLKRSIGLSLVVVDYLQLIAAITPFGERGRTREAEVAAVARGLKNLALDLSVPVLALSQFNREAMKTGGKPELHHLRESGEIEQAANVVLFLWHSEDDPDDPVRGDGVRRLLVAKHRSGAVGREIRMRWAGKTVAFTGEVVS